MDLCLAIAWNDDPVETKKSQTPQLKSHRDSYYSDVIMRVMASQINGVSIVYSTVCSGADQRKHQSSASLAFVRGIHRWPVNSPHKGPVTRKMFSFDDVIMATRLWLCRNGIIRNWGLLQYMIYVWNSYAVPCAKFQNDSPTEQWVVGKRDFTRFEFKVSLVRIFYIARAPWSV